MWIEPNAALAKEGKLSREAWIGALGFAYVAADIYTRDKGGEQLGAATFLERWTDVLLNGREDGAGVRLSKVNAALGAMFGLNGGLYRLEGRFAGNVCLCFEGSESLRPTVDPQKLVRIVQDWGLTNLPTMMSVVNQAEALMPWGLFSKLLNPRQAPSTQYDVADLVARAAIAKYGRETLIVTGHSLGGGLSQYVAKTHGLRAIVFNSAGIGFSPKTNAFDATILHMKTTGDFVNALVTDYSDALSRHLGKEIAIGRGGHGMEFIIASLRDIIRKTR